MDLAHELALARERNVQLQEALDSRVIIEQAKGVLVGALGLTIDDAFEALRRYSRNNHVKLRDLCERVVRLDVDPVVLRHAC